MNTQPPHNQPRGDRSVQANGNIAQSLLITGDHNIAVFQTILQPLPVSARGAVQRLLTYYTDNVFGGRDAELAALDGVLRGEQLYTLMVAPTGRGKTALLVHWVNRLLRRGEWRVIFVPISIRFGTAGEQMALEMLAAGLADLHNDTAKFQCSERSPFGLLAMIGDYLNRPLPAETRCLLVLDGIDEAVGWKVGPLCVVPPNSPLKIVAAARQRADRGYEDWREHLGWQPHRTRAFPLDNLDRAALIALLKAQDERLAALADDPAFVAQFERVSEGDPLTCNLLIKALLGNTLSPTDLSRRPPGLEAFLRDWVETLRRMRQESAAIRELLALCAVAYGPLTSDDLSALAPTVFSDQSAIVDAVRSDEVARFIITVGEHSYVFSHQRLREVFLEQIYPPTERERLHRRMVDYGKAWWADRHQPLSEYLRRFWLLHCAGVGEWERIREVVSAIVPTRDGSGVEQPWQKARYAAEGSNSGYLGDLDRLWTRAEQQGDLGLALRCALIAASLRSQSGNLSPKLLVGLVQVGTPAGTWSAAAALEHIALMSDSQRQAGSLKALLAAGITLPWARALEVALAIGDEYWRATALAALAPHLPTHLFAEALTTARTIADEYRRSEALAALAPHLPPHLFADALTTARTIDEYRRSEALAALAPHLPTHLFAEALAAARTIDSEYWRSEALAALAPHLPPPLLAEALAAARAIADERWRAQALAALAPHLPTDLLADALAAARAIQDADDRAEALAALAPHLPTEQQPAVYADALAAARALDEYFRPIVLAVLIPNLPTEQQPAVFAEALTAANAIMSDIQRPNALFAIANCPTSCPTLDEQFAPTLRMLAQGGRPALLADLWALQPWLAALAERRQPTMLAALATAISETGRCWP